MPAHSGTWYTWLGGDNDEIAYVQRQMTVPSSCPYLVFYHYVASQDSCGWDDGFVRINGTTVDSIQLCGNNNTNGWVKKVINLGAYSGQTVTLQIRAETDSINNSNWFIDDVSFQASASAGAGLEMESVSLKVDSASQFKTKKYLMKRRMFIHGNKQGVIGKIQLVYADAGVQEGTIFLPWMPFL